MTKGRRINTLGAELKAREHVFESGVSPQLGGNDEGAGPHELLEGALAACTIITVQMYANRKGIKLKSTDVEVRIISESKEATTISRKVSFLGDLTHEERQRLLEIANKCPIHRLLESHVTITTEQATS